MMSRLASWVSAFLAREDGPTAVEYAVMLALVIAVCVAAVGAMGTNTNGSLSYTATKISAS